jgi:hypothetical protein
MCNLFIIIISTTSYDILTTLRKNNIKKKYNHNHIKKVIRSSTYEPKCCESDSKLEKLRFLETANLGPEWCCLGARIDTGFFQPGTREKSAPEWRNSGPELSHQNISKTYIFGSDLFQLWGLLLL